MQMVRAFFMKYRRAVRECICAGVAALLVTAIYIGGLQLSGNFHPVIVGEIYRSAQPAAGDIASYQSAYGIQTIVNLRGTGGNSAWYETEIAEARKLGIAHIDFPMSASEDLSQDEAADLVKLLAAAEKPILIHCKAGADRSGLVAALYLAAIAHRDEESAESQISLRYGHISLPGAGAWAMDRSFEALEPWLGYHNS
ncbi:dual specificity protein phosphatase family protein [Nisaea sediminum]|uniref:dual specificity protein phosphatase family protein n=1 Tax=Nisaea sediminum TaxID=2775867 RepID=UPI001D02BBD5|nr:dual specificity protein phosphatase family protein [Nisaea sediminum]